MCQQEAFFDFLQFCIGSVEKIPASIKEADWKELYTIAQKQALTGVLFNGIKQLPKELAPNAGLLMRWMAQSQMLEKANVRLNDAAIQVSEWFRKKGFRTCILKGQGNAQLYPNGLYRTPGDIDLWVEGGDKRVISFVRSISPHEKACYHHIEFPIMGDIDVEVHFRPSWMSSPIINRRLQRWFEEEKVKIVEYNESRNEGFSVPTPAFNVIYQLIHIYRHLFDEGVGLRQIIDYYFVLESYCKTKPENDDVILLLKRFNLFSFAGAMMYVLSKALNMPDQYLICEPDARRGRHLLREIMIAGNFGWYDNRINRFHEIKGLGGVNNILQEGHNFFYKNKRNLKMLMLYPNEVLWTPYFMVYHWFWRKLKLWRF